MTNYKKLTQKEKDEYNAKRRSSHKEKIANMTDEEWRAYREKRHNGWIRYWNNLTPEEQQAMNAKILANKRAKWNAMTVEQKLKERERHRLRRESWTPEEREKERERARNNNLKLKIEVLSHYCNGQIKCANPECEVPGGARNILGLCVDHINGGGYKQSRQLREQGIRFYRWLKNNGFPSGYQILCASCNQIKKSTHKEDAHGLYRRKKLLEQRVGDYCI